jgi:hypothetical protein
MQTRQTKGGILVFSRERQARKISERVSCKTTDDHPYDATLSHPSPKSQGYAINPVEMEIKELHIESLSPI